MVKEVSFGRYGKKRKCRCQKNRKHLPFGFKSLTGYCHCCDVGAELKVSRKSARSFAKLEIEKELRNQDVI